MKPGNKSIVSDYQSQYLILTNDVFTIQLQEDGVYGENNKAGGEAN